jgi:hypothetical protein
VFGSVVVVAFQIAFRAEIHANDVFLFFKNHFWYQHIKTIQKVQTALNFSKKKKKKNLKFAEQQVEQQSQTLSCSMCLFPSSSEMTWTRLGVKSYIHLENHRGTDKNRIGTDSSLYYQGTKFEDFLANQRMRFLVIYSMVAFQNPIVNT